MHLVELRIKAGSHPAFQQDVEIQLDERVNLFIGPNASGKTSLLRVMAEAVLMNNATMIPFNAPQIGISDDWDLRFTNPTEADSQNLQLSEPWGLDGRLLALPWVYIPATRVSLPGEFDEEAVPFDRDKLVAGVFDNRLSIDWPDNSQVFNYEWVEYVVKRMFDHYKDGRKEFGQFRHTLRQSAKCATHIARETITGGLTNYVTNPSDLFAPDEVDPLAVEPYVHPGMGVFTRGNHPSGTRLQYAGNLSSGTQGVFLWILYVALRIAHHHQFERDWQNKPAILLIDEIENHLHPTWQRRVIPALLEHFPGLQIFATTHSPFVVAGLKAGQVHVFKRDENGVVTASTNERDVVGWTMDEILRGMMGVDDPTDEDTAKAAKELRQLRSEEPRSDEKEEEERQKRMQELREVVNRDLLAGGPVAAQRELFERNLAEILEEHRKAQGLNQD